MIAASVMKAMLATLGLTLAVAVFGAESLSFGGLTWTVPTASDWQVENMSGTPVLELLVGREPPSNLPRRPMQFAVINGKSFSSVTIEADAMPMARSLILVYGYTDSAHFDYAHLSTDTGVKQPRHNGIFRVAGGERERISSEAGPAAFAESKHWYHVVLRHDAKEGTVDVTVDGTSIPALHASDPDLKAGRVGLGSFDETASFKKVRVTGDFEESKF